MVLSDTDISRELGYGELEVEPVDLEEQLQPASLDIRLGGDVKGSSRHHGEIIDSMNFEGEEHFEDISAAGGVIIYPGRFYLANTKETFDIPDHLVGELTGRSSMARMGISIHQTAGLFDPGFEGEGVLEISNVGEQPVKLYPGQRIAQMKFTRLESPATNPYNSEDNKYQSQEGAQPSKMYEDGE